MKTFLRSWRWLILVGAIVLAPQVTLVHALSHLATQQTPGEQRHGGGVDKVCASCLALAQFGAVLPTRFDWVPRADALPEAPGPIAVLASLREPLAYQARAPPAVALI